MCGEDRSVLDKSRSYSVSQKTKGILVRERNVGATRLSFIRDGAGDSQGFETGQLKAW